MNIEELIKKLFEIKGFGPLTGPVTPVSGGFMHRMYKVCTRQKAYAVKHLNPEIMKRPGVFENYRRAEALERILEKSDIPVVAAIETDGTKMQAVDGEYFYIFDWLEGKITDWNNITPEQCRMAGHIQGRIHAVMPARTPESKPEPSAIDWGIYIEEAAKKNSEILPVLKVNEALLIYAQDEMNRARLALPPIECITDEDMDPKNVMWKDGRPYVIDLECLDYGNPVSHVLQLSLQWSGITTCTLDLNKTKAFFDGYLDAYDNGFRDYASVSGVAYTWIEWLEYNITRSLSESVDESERKMGMSEVNNTIARIRYIREHEDMIREILSNRFRKENL